MLRLVLVTLAFAAAAMAEGFSFTIGNPVASQDFLVKTAAFVFRTEGCAEPAKPQISATAEGIVKGARHSVPLKVTPSSRAGIYGVHQTWPPEGQWLVHLKGTCGELSAGALVPIGPKGLIRESSKLLPRPATDSEIEARL